MFKKLAILAALLAVSPAEAAVPPCWPNLNAGITLTIKPATTTEPVAVGDIIYAASSVGLIWGYACVSNGIWYHNVAGGQWSSFPASWAAIADTMIRGTDADRVAAWNKYATVDPIDPLLQPDVVAIKKLLPTPPPIIPPPPPVVEYWIVATFAANLDRPAYPVVAGVRKTTSNGRALVGSVCNCTVKFVETSTYCGVNGRLDQVAICKIGINPALPPPTPLPVTPP